MSDVVWKSFLAGAAILSSAGPLSLFLLVPVVWDHLLDGELVRAVGWAFVAIANAVIFGTLVYGAIDTAHKAGIKQGAREARHGDIHCGREGDAV